MAGRKSSDKKIPPCKVGHGQKRKKQGGISIRDPEQMNKALGAKLIWRLVTGRKDWWKEVIRKKYIRRPRSKMLDNAWTGKGTTLW